MVGDFILWVRGFFKQTFCVHEYEYKEILGGGFFRCRKCGRIRASVKR